MYSEKIFKNREEAGKTLGEKLIYKYKDKNPIILAIPKGGVEVGFQVARILNGEFSLIITQKLPFPEHEELFFGAIGEDGSTYISSIGKNLDQKTIEEIKVDQSKEIKRKLKEFRNNQPIPDISGRIVIIVDDGITSGTSIIPALQFCKKHNALEVVVAAPVSGRRHANEIEELSDNIVILQQPGEYYSVSQFYEEFEELEEREVSKIFKKFYSTK